MADSERAEMSAKLILRLRNAGVDAARKSDADIGEYPGDLAAMLHEAAATLAARDKRIEALVSVLKETKDFLFDDDGSPIAPEDLRQRVQDAIYE
jgi:hypothetical protein